MNKLAWNPIPAIGKLWKPVGKTLGKYTTQSKNPVVKWTSRAGLPVVGVGALGGIPSYFEGKSQGQQNMVGVGQDAGRAALAKQMENMPQWQKELVAVDPSLAMVMGEKRMPGMIAAYEQQSGQKFKPGLIGSLFNQDSGKPMQYTDNSGQILT